MTENSNENARWNFLVLTADWITFNVGMSFVSSVTILPTFVRSFTDSNLAVGLITSLWALGHSIPPILVANHVEGLSRAKPYMLKVTAGERIPWLVLALLVFFAGSSTLPWILPSFFLLYLVVTSSGGFTSPAWMDLVARAVSQRIRGKYFGLANSVSTAVGALGGLAAGLFLNTCGFPNGFGLCFLAAFLLTLLSWGFMASIKEPGREPAEPRTGLGTYLSRLPTVLREDSDFRLFIVSQVLLGFIGMATAFYTAYAIDLLHPTGDQIGIFTFIFLGVQAFTNLLWGYLGDKKGHKLTMQLGYTCGIAAALAAAFARSILAFDLVFALAGAASSALVVSWLSILPEFAGPRNRPTYFAAASALTSPFSAAAPLLGGVLASLYQPPPVFLLAAAIAGVGLFMLTAVRDPRSRSTN
ncbi:MAG: MFS transporter [Aigarchaeota archaeon]|nr:MFS transporter [Aigarchaeota archaeon]